MEQDGGVMKLVMRKRSRDERKPLGSLIIPLAQGDFVEADFPRDEDFTCSFLTVGIGNVEVISMLRQGQRPFGSFKFC